MPDGAFAWRRVPQNAKMKWNQLPCCKSAAMVLTKAATCSLIHLIHHIRIHLIHIRLILIPPIHPIRLILLIRLARARTSSRPTAVTPG